MLFTVSLFNTRTHTQTHTLSKESEKESEEEDGDDENKRRLRGPNHPDDKVNAFLMIVLMIVSFLMIVCVYMYRRLSRRKSGERWRRNLCEGLLELEQG